jgi:hypothetical protein
VRSSRGRRGAWPASPWPCPWAPAAGPARAASPRLGHACLPRAAPAQSL